MSLYETCECLARYKPNKLDADTLRLVQIVQKHCSTES